MTISELLPGFTDYLKVERRRSPRTIKGYREGIKFFTKIMGDISVSDLTLKVFISFKARMVERGAGESRVGGIINGMKSILMYTRDVLEIPVMDVSAIKAPRPPRRQVSYLTPEELEIFLAAIPLRTWTGKTRLSGHCFRALVETLASTGMRISEALSLNREMINFERKEAIIIGKGNKQRTVFFTDRALQWITRYLDLRNDSDPALFLTLNGKRLSIDSVEPKFRRNCKWAGMEKRVTPHMIRHTTATNLLRNGCPVGFIKEILGHEQLETTCRYYLGIMNKKDTQKAHEAYSDFIMSTKKEDISRDPFPEPPAPPPNFRHWL
jgi:integrase/recombinase XerD